MYIYCLLHQLWLLQITHILEAMCSGNAIRGILACRSTGSSGLCAIVHPVLVDSSMTDNIFDTAQGKQHTCNVSVNRDIVIR